jgi:sec-independent protein translocase protein TatA
VLLLVFGAKRLPEFGRSLGTGMREFKHSVSDQPGALEPATLAPTTAPDDGARFPAQASAQFPAQPPAQVAAAVSASPDADAQPPRPAA